MLPNPFWCFFFWGPDDVLCIPCSNNSKDQNLIKSVYTHTVWQWRKLFFTSWVLWVIWQENKTGNFLKVHEKACTERLEPWGARGACCRACEFIRALIIWYKVWLLKNIWHLLLYNKKMVIFIFKKILSKSKIPLISQKNKCLFRPLLGKMHTHQKRGYPLLKREFLKLKVHLR